MSIVFPRPMPATGAGQQLFEPKGVDFETAETGGAAFGISAGLPRWTAQWTLANGLGRADSDEWEAFIASLKGSQRSFLGKDYRRPFPKLYLDGFGGLSRAGGGAFDGSLTSWSQTIATDGQALLTLNGLPAGFTLSLGDYLDFRWTTLATPRRALVRMLEPATSNGAGVISGISVEPAVPVLVVPPAAVAHLDDPACVMRLLPDTRISPVGRRQVIAGSLIVARQDLRP
jgi:hypothetical protein